VEGEVVVEASLLGFAAEVLAADKLDGFDAVEIVVKNAVELLVILAEFDITVVSEICACPVSDEFPATVFADVSVLSDFV
jgi:hypothetical protein